MSTNSIHADPPPPIVTEPSGINYATGSALGKGGFAICHRAERYDGSVPTGQVVALKIVRSKMEPAKIAQKFVTELQIHSKLSHPNIVTFYRAFSFQASTYVVLELCSNGSLADMLKRRKHLTLPEIRRLVIQVCGAVKYLHHRHIVHRDLKTGNLFLDSNMNVKVGDFGLAALLVTEKEMEVRRRTTMCGTPNYLAPEILEKGKGHDEKVDLWAIGVIAYTLAVGKAPFHASTKEEIYKKLKSGAYTWPELSATSNQSTDLRSLVSSLLVPEEFRPLPDQIVSHAFFKIAYVPQRIPSSAREKAPSWTDVALPSVETLRRGYSDTWYTLCKESGVGEHENGRCFPLNGGGKVRSIVHDMAREAQAGRQPTMPIPKDTVYTSMMDDVGSRSESEKRGLMEISHNEVSSTRPRVTARTTVAKVRDDMPPPPLPRTGSCVDRNETSRRVARTISEETTIKKNEVVKVASDQSTTATECLQSIKARQTGSAAGPSLREPNTTSTSYQTAQSCQPSLEAPGRKLERTGSTKRSADASLARRPRGTRTMKERPISPEDVRPNATSTIAPRRIKRDQPRSDELVAAPSTTPHDLKQAPLFEPKPEVRLRGRNNVVEVPSDPEEEEKQTEERNQRPQPSKNTARLPQKASRSIDVPTRGLTCVSGTDPDSVLRRLSNFRDNLAAELAASRSSCSSSSREPHPCGMRSTSSTAASDLPFVSRWVDYSRKHGVGYVLADGTVGCIINSRAAASKSATSERLQSTPVTHVLVRNGQRWLSEVGNARTKTSGSAGKDSFAGLESVPLEIFEDWSTLSTEAIHDGAIHRKVYKGLGSVRSGPLAVEADRRRTLAVLWVKFGRYMCQSLLDTTPACRTGTSRGDAAIGGCASDAEEDEVFVRFYQRFASPPAGAGSAGAHAGVGIWAFSDGCLQVHFPDHTKIVLSSDGLRISATLLSLEAAASVAERGELLPQHVSSREVYTYSVAEILRSSPSASSEAGAALSSRERVELRQRAKLMKANQVREKLEFVKEVVGQWVRNEGLGRMDEDVVGDGDADARSKHRLCWEGLAVRDDASTKRDTTAVVAERVTVGRCGGD